MDINNIKIGCVGCGTMGGTIMKALCKNLNPKNIYVSSAHYENAKKFADENNCNACKELEKIVNCDIIFVGVKPAQAVDIVKKISVGNAIIVTMAAGIKIQDYYCPAQFIRIMPNIPAMYGEGMTGLCSNNASEESIELVKQLLSWTGKVEVVPEKLMDGVTAISGSGPAYGFMFIEALADAAVRFGIPRKQAYIYAAQTLKGAATMALEDSRSPAELKDAVCSPAGTTIEAVVALENAGFRSAVINGATACWKRSIELGKK